MKGIEKGVLLFNLYEVIKGLGEGGTSVVYLAKNVKVGNLVAIKVVYKNHSYVNLMAEKNLLKELRHCAIPIIMDIEEDDEAYYLVEEYVEGMSLGHFKMQLSEDQIMDLMMQLADVLEYLHTVMDRPIIYRDLKPDNVIRMDNGHIKLVDFGIAVKDSDENHELMKLYGTKGYAAPEQLSKSKCDERTDIYALGVCMYYLLTGKNLSTPPYRLRPIKELCPEMDDGLGKMITKCIQTIPAKRYQNMTQIKVALETLKGDFVQPPIYETFLEKSPLVITVASVKKGLGTTHCSLMLATYFAANGYEVAFVELSNRDDVIKISSMCQEVDERRHYFRMYGMDCYPYLASHYYNRVMDKSYEVIIVDGGTCEELSAINGHELAHQTYVLVGSKDWEIDYFEAFYYDKMNLEGHYWLNLSSQETCQTLKKVYKIRSITAVPFNPNPYQLTDVTKEFFAQCLQMGKGQPEERRTSLYDYIKKVLNNGSNYLRKST